MANVELCPFSWIKVSKPAGCFSALLGGKRKIVSEPQSCMESNCQFWQDNGRGCSLVKPKAAMSAVDQSAKLSPVLPNNELRQLLELEMAEANAEPVEHTSQVLPLITSPPIVSSQKSQSSEELGKGYVQESQAPIPTLIASAATPAGKSSSKTIAVVISSVVAVIALGGGAYLLNMKNKQEVAALQAKLDEEQRTKQEEMRLEAEAQAKAAALEQQRQQEIEQQQEITRQQELAHQQEMARQPVGTNKKSISGNEDAAMLKRAHKSLDDLLKQ